MIAERVVVDGVAWAGAEIEFGLALEVEQCGFSWHKSVHHAEFVALRIPFDRIDRTFLGCTNKI